MIIQGSTSSYGAALQSSIARQGSQNSATISPSKIADTVTISDAARKALAASSASPPEKSSDQMTAEELDALQKKGGWVNTMANLSPTEKALYNKAIASGNTDAAAGLGQIALIRMGSVAGGASGTTYDPRSTAITATNIQQYFSQSIVDPSGTAKSNFQSLIQFLQSNPSA